MPIRIEVREDGEIEVMRSWVNDPMTKFLRFKPDEFGTLVKVILPYLIKREMRRQERNRFVPEFEKEAKKAYKQLHEEAERHYGKRKKGGAAGTSRR
jgi:hypothetical protein